MPEKEDLLTSKYLERLTKGLMKWQQIDSPQWRGQVRVTGVSVRCQWSDEVETLVVIKGTTEEGVQVVGFHSEVGMLDALAGAARRLVNGTIKWREDNYA